MNHDDLEDVNEKMESQDERADRLGIEIMMIIVGMVILAGGLVLLLLS